MESNKLSQAFDKLMDAESKFAEAIDNFNQTLDNDSIMRNHPQRVIYSSKVMEQHHHCRFVNTMIDMRIDMEEDGFFHETAENQI